MYFALLASSALYSVLFLFSRIFLRKNGPALMRSLVFSAAFSVILTIYGFAVVGFRPTVTPLAIGVAAGYGACQAACTSCGIIAMSRTTLSRVATFIMLGGMAFPLAYGAIFRSERFSPWQIACLVLVGVSLVLTWEGKREKKGVLPILFSLFVISGIMGVLSKVHESSESKVDPFNFILLFSFFTAVFSIVLTVVLRIVKKEPPRVAVDSYLLPAGFAFCYGIALTLLFTTVKTVPASHQNAVLTGGTIVFVSVISAIIREKPTVRGIISVLAAVLASVCLVL